MPIWPKKSNRSILETVEFGYREITNGFNQSTYMLLIIDKQRTYKAHHISLHSLCKSQVTGLMTSIHFDITCFPIKQALKPIRKPFVPRVGYRR